MMCGKGVWQAGAPQPAKSPGNGEEPEAARTPRSRRLFGLLPSRPRDEGHGEADELPGERREPPIEDLTAGDADSEEDDDGEPSRSPAELPAVPLQPRAPRPAVSPAAPAAARGQRAA